MIFLSILQLVKNVNQILLTFFGIVNTNRFLNNNLLIAKLIHNRVNRQIESITRGTAIISTRAHIKHRRVRLTSTNRTIDRMRRREAIMSSQSRRGCKRTHSIGSHNRRV